MRKFKIVSMSIRGRIEQTIEDRTPYSAVKRYVELHHPGYRFTGGLQTTGPCRYTGEAYNDSHGLKVYVTEL